MGDTGTLEPNNQPTDATLAIPPVLDQPPRVYIRMGYYVALGVVLLAIVVIAAYKFVVAFLDVSTPFVVGTILALLLDPVTHRLERSGLSRPMAIFVVFSATVFLLTGLGFLVIPRLVEQVTNFGASTPQYIESLRNTVDTWLSHHRHVGPVLLPKNSTDLLSQLTQKFSSTVQGSAGNVTELLKGSATTLIQAIVTLMVMFYILADMDRLRGRAIYLVPSKYRGMAQLFGRDIGNVFSDYLRGLLIVCTMYGVTVIAVLYVLAIFKHPIGGYALLAGIFAGVLYSVPYVGAISIALMTFFIGFTAGGWVFGCVTMVAVLTTNQIYDNIITPRVVGGGVGLHPVAAILALALGARLGGFWGLVLSVPIAASIQAILFRVFPRLTKPTPDDYLRSAGVANGDPPIHKIDETVEEKAADEEERKHPPT
ncbi:MAG TPA: AI-2E family transporter [Capsulimonadaceae bacterium]|jgi:predicted PurR-regulated permease PerM